VGTAHGSTLLPVVVASSLSNLKVVASFNLLAEASRLKFKFKLFYKSFIVRMSLSFWLAARRKKGDRKGFVQPFPLILAGTIHEEHPYLILSSELLSAARTLPQHLALGYFQESQPHRGNERCC
jgi:hypothetical protein